MHFDLVWPSFPYLLEGLRVTFFYTILSVFFGLILGVGLALMKVSHQRVLSFFAHAYTSVFRGTPLILQLSLVYFAPPQLFSYNISIWEAGILSFSLNSAAYISEIIRAGIQGVDRGQFEAAFALGVSPFLSMRDIILPQAVRKILPALVNELVDLLKESALISTLGEADLLRRATILAAEKHLYFEPLLIVGGIYYLLIMVLTLSARKLEKALNP